MKKETNLARLGVSTVSFLLYGVIGLYLIGLSSAYAQATAPVLLIFKNECEDLPPEAFITATNLAEWEALTLMWECHNRTQASQKQEIYEKVHTAAYNVKLKKRVTIVSIDPIMKGKYTGDFYNDDVSYTYGAWKIGRNAFAYADMPGCGNARKVLQKLLRRIK